MFCKQGTMVFANKAPWRTAPSGSLLTHCPTISSTKSVLCAPGCWNEGGQFMKDGLRVCSPVGPGYYGPIHSNERFPCQPGTASDDPEAVACRPCQPGSMAPLERLPQCIACPPGYFQDKFGKETCFPCNPGYYYGQGSVGITTNGFCIGGEGPSALPSNQPTSRPSVAPSTSPGYSTAAPSWEPSHAPHLVSSAAPNSIPSLTPSSEPSNSPSKLTLTTVILLDQEDPKLEEGACSKCVLHGRCAPCPSILGVMVGSMLLLIAAAFYAYQNWFSAETIMEKTSTATVEGLESEKEKAAIV